MRHTGKVSADTPDRVTYREVLADREFRAMFSAGGLSVIGDQLARIAIALLVFERTGSALAASAIYACSYLTWLVGGPLLSVLADRYRRRRLMIGSDVARMVLIGVLALPGIPLWVVFAVLILAGLLAPPFEAARSALLADVLEGEAYVRGNMLNQSVFQFGHVVGFMTGGALVALIGVRGALFVDAVTFGLSALLLLYGVRERDRPVIEADRKSLLRETAAGAQLVARSPRLRRLLAWALLSAGIVIVPEGLAVSVSNDLGGGAVQAGVLTASVPLGFLVGSFFLARAAPARREALFAPLTLLSIGPLLLTPVLDAVWMVSVAWVIAGLGNSLQLIANASFVQSVPAGLRGRAFGIAVAGLMAVQGVVLLLAGALAEFLDARQSVAAVAVAGLVLMPLAAVSGRSHVEIATGTPQTGRVTT